MKVIMNTIIIASLLLSGCATKIHNRTKVYDYNDYYSIADTSTLNSFLTVTEKRSLSQTTFRVTGSVNCSIEQSEKYVIDETYIKYNIMGDYIEIVGVLLIHEPLLGWIQWTGSPIDQTIGENYAENLASYAAHLIPGTVGNFPLMQEELPSSYPTFHKMRVEQKSNVILRKKSTISKKNSKNVMYDNAIPITFIHEGKTISRNKSYKYATQINLTKLASEHKQKGDDKFMIKAIIGDANHKINGRSEFTFIYDTKDYYEYDVNTTFTCDTPNSLVRLGNSLTAMKEYQLPETIEEVIIGEDGKNLRDETLFAQFIADGYHSEIFSIPLNTENQKIEGKAHFIKEKITADVSGVSVIIDGKKYALPYQGELKGIVTYVNENPIPCDFPARNIQIVKDGYSSFKATLSGNSDRFLSLKSKSLKDDIISKPSGADILENGVKVGTTPYLKTYRSFDSELSLSQRSITLKKLGYEDTALTLASSRTDREKNVTLNRLPSGFIKLTSNEDNVQIYVNGKLLGTIKDKSTPFNFSLPIGQHDITAKKEFFREKTFHVKMGKDELAEIEFEIKKAADWNQQEAKRAVVTQSIGELRVLTTRTDLNVVIDGITKSAPFVLNDVPSGQYKVQIIGGGMKKTITVQIDDGETEILNLDEMF